jgi:Arc/MetJ family transcription regulator
MKRTNVILDEEVLEKARRLSGERTYSATLMTALEEYIRVKELDRALDEVHGMGDEAFAPGFLQAYERERKQRIVVDPKKVRVSADERRLLSEKKSTRRGSR